MSSAVGSSLVVVTLATLVMLVGTGHCLMSNNTSSNAAGNNIIAVSTSAGWCVDGHMIDGECTLRIADAADEDMEMDGMDMMVEGESIRRGLLPGHQPPVTKPASFYKGRPVVDGHPRYTPLPNNNKDCRDVYNKGCKPNK